MNTVERAARLAMVAHNGTNRKGPGNVPYIVHPHAVVAMLKEWGFSEENDPVTLAVAWCHDVLEDTDTPEEAILGLDAAFGAKVLDGVRRLTFCPHMPSNSPDYGRLKAAYIETVARTAPPEILVVKIADRLCNTSDFLADGRPAKALEYFGYGEPLFARIPVCNHARAIERSCRQVLQRLLVANKSIGGQTASIANAQIAINGIDSPESILKRIALPCRDNGVDFTDTRRLSAIAECLGGSWQLLVDGRLAKIYARPEFNPKMPAVVISSHVDMVADHCYADCDGELWRGSFDNLITNAAVVSGMKQMSFNPNVLVAFTGDEEEDSRGADEVFHSLRSRGVKISCVIVTDVTDVGWKAGKCYTIENIFPDDGQSVAKLLSVLLPQVVDVDKQPKVVVEGECDEAWQYDEHDLRCFSVCLPCHGNMHSEEGVAVRGNSVEIYLDVLVRFANAL